MRPERDEFLAAAAETRFPAETLEKVARLGELVVEVGRHPLVGLGLALKGGTALNLLADAPPRLSVDLDFTFIGALEREEMLRARPEIEAAVGRIGRALGCRLQKSREEHAGRKLHLGYTNLYRAPDRIEVDLNFLNRQPLLDPIELPLWQPAGAPRPSVRAMALEEIAAKKLSALLDRAAARDLFDAALLPNRLGTAWGGSRFRRLFVATAGVLPRALESYDRSRFNRLSPALIGMQLRPVLPAGALPPVDELRENARRAALRWSSWTRPSGSSPDGSSAGSWSLSYSFPKIPESPSGCCGIRRCSGRPRTPARTLRGSGRSADAMAINPRACAEKVVHSFGHTIERYPGASRTLATRRRSQWPPSHSDRRIQISRPSRWPPSKLTTSA